MAKIFEHAPGEVLTEFDTDGMREFMQEVDEPTSTDWDGLVENPPHEGLEDIVMPHLQNADAPKPE